MPINILQINSEVAALNALAEINTQADLNLDFSLLERSLAWVTVDVYIPEPREDASISPTMMEAYIRLQKSIYQTVALAKYGQATTLKLSDEDKEKYEINVVVKEGSSDQHVDLDKIFTSLGHDLIGKMTSAEIFYTILALAVLYAGHQAWRTFLEDRRTIRLAEISSQEKQRILEAFETLSTEETQRTKQIMERALPQIPFGQDMQRRSDAAKEAILKAVSEGSTTKVQDVELSPAVAKELRSSNRRRANLYTIEKQMRVIDLNTQDELLIVALLEDPETFEVVKVGCRDAILAETARNVLFEALRSRQPVVVRMEVKDLEGEIIPQSLLSASSLAPESLSSGNP